MSEHTEFQRKFAESMTEIGAAFQRLADALQPAVIAAGQEIQRFAAALDEQWPQWREFAANVPNWQPEPMPRACNCFCAVAHGGLGVCTGEAAQGFVRFSHLGGERVDIPVCGPCFDAPALVRT